MKSNKKEIVYNIILKQIQDKIFEPGEWLVERDLCSKFGLSRTPLREVLWNLSKDGLLTQTPGKGFQVRQLSLQEILEVFQAREAVEGMAAFIVPRLRDEEFFLHIRDLREKLESIDDNDENFQIKGPEIGFRMHQLIINYANNSLLKEFEDKLLNLYSLTVNLTRRSHKIELISKSYHLKIMKAIESRDSELAEKMMREHLRSTCREITTFFFSDY